MAPLGTAAVPTLPGKRCACPWLLEKWFGGLFSKRAASCEAVHF
jgi:hypothetical protein